MHFSFILRTRPKGPESSGYLSYLLHCCGYPTTVHRASRRQRSRGAPGIGLCLIQTPAEPPHLGLCHVQRSSVNSGVLRAIPNHIHDQLGPVLSEKLQTCHPAGQAVAMSLLVLLVPLRTPESRWGVQWTRWGA